MVRPHGIGDGHSDTVPEPVKGPPRRASLPLGPRHVGQSVAMVDDSAADEERAYARRMLTDAVAWSTDRTVLVVPDDDGNARVQVVATTLLGDPVSGLCVAQLADEPHRWYYGGDNDDHVLLFGWDETQEDAWLALY